MHIRCVLAFCVLTLAPGCDDEDDPSPSMPNMPTTMPEMPSSGGGGGECNVDGDDCLLCSAQHCCDPLAACSNDEECTSCAFEQFPCEHPTFLEFGDCQASNCSVECGVGSNDSGDPSGGGGGPGDPCTPNAVPSGCRPEYVCLVCPNPSGIGESARCVLGGC